MNENEQKISNDLKVVEAQGKDSLNELAWTALEDAISRIDC